ncbi:MAG TPA: hypothetical protein VHU40_22420 [Polyangia bacterium]|nr:hypothetical protein [Polyangia bacterium]
MKTLILITCFFRYFVVGAGFESPARAAEDVATKDATTKDATKTAAKAGAKNCRIQIPVGWEAFTLKWVGGCSRGLADGRGALRATVQGKVARLFLGAVRAGELEVGAVDTGEGYIAGRFKDGKAVDSEERSDSIKGFDEAAAAAKEVSETFKAAGNAASAKFYATKATQLANQLD